jgi:NTP pyrophosphatase (non-canonical NTP hydrolase)
LYFEQLTPLAILSTTAEETGQTIDEVEQDIDDSMENPEEMEDNSVQVGNISETTNDKILN